MGKTINRDQTTIRRQELGRELQTVRKKRRLTLEEAAKRINCSQSKLCRIEKGQRSVAIDEVAGLLGLYGVEGKERDDLLELAGNCGERGWWQRTSSDFHQRRSTFSALESRAETIVDFELTVIPGLLQTADYARALMVESPTAADDEIDDLLMTRLLRQSVLRRKNPPKVLALIDEPVLHRPVGGHGVLRRQLEHLLLASGDPNLSIRVVPNVGYHAGITGAFHILELPGAPSVVFLEGLASNLFLEDPVDVDLYRQALRNLLDAALDEQASRALIATVARSLDTEASTDAPDQPAQPDMA
jgi:transcriptional regulator with XRE-family HTH domain